MAIFDPADFSFSFDLDGRRVISISPGASPSTTDDLPEGVTNLYYTNTRADARVTIGVNAHVADGDPHTQYRLESADHSHQSTGLQAGTLDHGLALTGLSDNDHPQYMLVSAAAALTKVDDTNVTVTLGGTPGTALMQPVSLTLGWTGTLAAGRLNANVVQSVVNDTNVTGSIAAQALTLGWTGTLSVARGGIGVGTLASNGVLYGNAAGAVQALAVNAGAKQFLTQTSSGAPAWASVVAGDLPANGANPTASIGLAAVNGSATTWMRSDGAPALSQAIAPTWTASHLWTQTITAGGNTLINAQMTLAPSGVILTNNQALNFSVNHTTGNFSMGEVRGIVGSVTESSGFTLTTGVAIKATVTGTSGTITTGIGLDATAGGTITTWVGVNVNRNETSTTSIGLRIQAQGGSTTTDIAIQSLGGENRFVGNVKIGANSSPAVPLDVVGAIKGSTTINALTGFQVNSAAALNSLLVGNGTNFVANTMTWTTVAYSAGDYVGVTGTWTVASGDLVTFKYLLIGNTMHVTLRIAGSTITVAGADWLKIKIPGSKTAVSTSAFPIGALNAGTQITTALAFLLPGVDGTYLWVAKSYTGASGGDAWALATDTTTLDINMAFEVA